MFGIYLYRIEHFLYVHHFPLIPSLIKCLIYLLFNAYIPYEVKIGSGSKFGYGGLGIVLHPRAKIGQNVIISQQVTVGGRSKIYNVPIIGNNVLIGTGAKILGDVTIGNNVVIGANAVVVESVPDNCVVAGVPAKVIKRDIDIHHYL
jgi:serine O-acetyltransferase